MLQVGVGLGVGTDCALEKVTKAKKRRFILKKRAETEVLEAISTPSKN